METQSINVLDQSHGKFKSKGDNCLLENVSIFIGQVGVRCRANISLVKSKSNVSLDPFLPCQSYIFQFEQNYAILTALCIKVFFILQVYFPLHQDL